MKLIIDINEKDYEYIKELGLNGYRDQVNRVVEAMANGTPLPKGHGDLIDRNQILQGEHFVVLGGVQVGDKNFGEQEIDMFPKQTIMSVKPVIEADKGE